MVFWLLMGAAGYAAYRKAGSPSLQNLLTPKDVLPASNVYAPKNKNNLTGVQIKLQDPTRFAKPEEVRNDRAFVPGFDVKQLTTMRNNGTQLMWPNTSDAWGTALAQIDYDTRGPGGTYITGRLKDVYYYGNQNRFNPVERSKVADFSPDITGYRAPVVF
jgi:hypothetical protein